TRPPPRPTLSPYTTLFRSWRAARSLRSGRTDGIGAQEHVDGGLQVRLHAGVVRAPAQAAGHARVQVALEQGEELAPGPVHVGQRSEEHTSELQSRENLVCR